jgi:periplasmic copper chaperone A
VLETRSPRSPRSNRHPVKRPSRRIAATMLVTGIAAAVISVASPAEAHVEVSGATTAPDGVTTVEFGWVHGCDGQATTALEMQLPEGATVGAASLPAGWGASGEGRVLRLEGPAIADGTPAVFSIELTGYDTSVEQLVPTVQICPDGEEAWIGADPEANDAAPRIAATTLEPPTATSTTALTTPDGNAVDDNVGVTSTGDSQATSAQTPWATFIAVAAGLVVVAAAVTLLVVRSRRAAP